MTDTLLDYDPNDTGDIPRPVGEDRTVIIRRDTTREVTQNLGHEIAGLPPRRRPAADETVTRMRLIEPALGLNHHDMSRVVELDDTVTFGLAGPQSPPPPLPPIPRPSVPPKYDMADAQLIAPWERVADTDRLTLLDTVAGVDGELRPNRRYVGRHRDPLDRIAVAGQRQWELITDAAKPGGEPRRLRVQVGVGAFIAFAAAVTVVVLWVFW